MSKTDLGNEKTGAPKLLIEQGNVAEGPDAMGADAEDVASAEGAATGRGRRRRHARKKARKERITRDDLADAVGFIQGLGASAWAYAEDHPFTVGYAFVGLVLAVLILTIGLWSTIVIAVFVLVGALLGQIRDGDNGLVNFFGRLFDRRS